MAVEGEDDDRLTGQQAGDEPQQGGDVEGAATPAPEGEEPTQEGQEEAEQPFDPTLVHAAHRAGMTNEQINKLGEGAEDALQQLKKGQDEVSRRFGQLGQQVAQGQQGGQPGQQQEGAGQTPSNPMDALQPGQDGQQPNMPSENPNALTGQPQGQQAQSQGQPQGQQGADQEPVEVPELDPEIYGSDFVEHYKSMAQELQNLRSQFQRVRQPVQQMQQERNRRNVQRALDVADGVFNDLPESYQQRFGAGETANLDRDSEHFENRLKVLRQAHHIRLGAQQQGENMEPREALERALSVVAPELKTQTVRDELVRQAEEASGQEISEPGGRGQRQTPAEGGGDDAAKAAYRDNVPDDWR